MGWCLEFAVQSEGHLQHSQLLQQRSYKTHKKNHNPLSMCETFDLKTWMDISKIHGIHWLLRFFYLVLEKGHALLPRVDL